MYTVHLNDDLLCELNKQTGRCKEFPEINKKRQTK